MATVYELTPWGRELYDIVVRLGRWGARQLLDGQGERSFRARYTIPVIQTLYAAADLDGLQPLSVRIDHDDEHVRVTVDAAVSMPSSTRPGSRPTSCSTDHRWSCSACWPVRSTLGTIRQTVTATATPSAGSGPGRADAVPVL